MKKLTEAQKRKIKKDRFINRLFLLGVILFFTFALWVAYNNYFRYDIFKSRILANFENKELASNQICMFSNVLKMGPTKSVLIDGEIYYVCCPGCEDNLKHNYQDSQYAVDVYSHHRIKKSKAFIVLNKNSSRKVRYFESEKNLNQFINTN